MAAAGLPDQARLAFQGRADASLDELLPRCLIKRRAEDFVVDEIDEAGQRASEAMTRAPEATLRAALDDLAAKLDSRQQEPAADVDESDVEGLQRFGRTRGSKAAATIEAPADKDARRAVHTTLAAAFRACETKTLDGGRISARWRGGRKRRRDGPRWPLVVRCVLARSGVAIRAAFDR